MLWYFCAFAASLHWKCKQSSGPGWQAEHQGDRQVKYEYTHIFTFISLLQLQSAASTASCCGCASIEEEGEEVGTGNRIKSQQNY